MRQFVCIGLLIVCSSGCDDSASQDVNSGLPLTQSDLAEATGVPVKKIPDATEARPKPKKVGPFPKVVAKDVTYEFGRMQLGDHKHHAFTISNEGEETLKLQAGESTCKCTQFELEETSLEPGESTVLNIEWHGALLDKNFRHGGPVYTDDPKRKKINFAVTGEVDAPFRVMPENNWRIGPFARDVPGKFQAVICSDLFDEFSVTNIECDSPFVTASTEPMTESDMKKAEVRCGYYVNVEVSPEMPPGYMEETIRFSFDKGEEHDMQIDIAATREGPIKVVDTDGGFWVASKNGLRLGQFQKRAGREAILTLAVPIDSMENDLEIVSTECSPRFVNVTLEPAPSSSDSVKRYLLTVRVPPGIPKTIKTSSDPAEVVVTTNHPTAPEFRFGVSFKAF